MEPSLIGYKSIEKIGEGSFGKVMRVINDDGDNFAIKIVSKESIILPKGKEKLRRELVISLRLKHPHIVTCLDAKEDEENAYFVMEYCEKSLRKDIEEQIRIKEEKALIYFRHLVSGFKMINDNNIIHRDIKPENILIKEGILKICDMGFARLAEEGFDFKIPRKLSRLGTLSYRSYEVLKGLPYSEKYDIWCLGLTFYEILVGKHPWDYVVEEALLDKFEKCPLTFPKDIKISSKTKSLIKSMLEIKEENRMSPKELFDHEYFKDKLKDIMSIYENVSISISKNSNDNRVVDLNEIGPIFGIEGSFDGKKSGSVLKQSVYDEIRRLIYIDVTRSRPLRKIVEIELKKKI